MDIITIILLIIVLAVLIIVLIKLSNIKSEAPVDPSLKIESMIKGEFLTFQTNLQKSLQETRKEVSASKDMMSKQSIETLKTIR